MSTPVQTYFGLYAHVLKLASRAIGRKWMYLFVAPLIGIPYGIIAEGFGRIAGGNMGAGLVGGFVLALLRAAAISCVLYAGRAIVEQRKLKFDDLSTGFSAFLWDIVTVFFVLWIISYLLAYTVPMLVLALYFVVFVMLPTFEVVALTSASSYGIFEAAWRFVQRDAFPWLAGQLPVLALIPLYSAGIIGVNLLGAFMPSLIAPFYDRFAGSAVFMLLALVAFVYRGILFLTLDSMSPRARAERFGGVPSLR